LFDIDGTLLNSGGAGKAAMESALLEEFGLPELVRQVVYSGRTDRSIMRDLMHFHEVEQHPEHQERLIGGYLRRLPNYLRHHEGTVLPGIADLLEILARREDVAVGLLTGNLREGARVKLGHFGLFDFFAFGGFGDHHWERDDVAREALVAVQERFGPDVSPERIWVIGDTPLDVSCARAIGARVAAVATGWHSLDDLAACKPDLLLRDLSDPAPLLAQLPGSLQ
jgi:phosphoglycolate phosphatase-like HAD superfamily hydrolase